MFTLGCNFLSTQGLIFKFLPIQGHTFFICLLKSLKDEVKCLPWGVKKCSVVFTGGSNFIPLFKFLQPPAQLNLAFKPRMLDMKTKQAKQQELEGSCISWSTCHQL